MTQISTYAQIGGIAIAAAGNLVMLFTDDMPAFTVGSQVAHFGLFVFVMGVFFE